MAYEDYNIIPYFDYTFRVLFIDANGGESLQLNNMEELLAKIGRYERESNTRLRVMKSNSKGYRQYKCATHRNCTFMANFGPNGVNHKIVLKTNYLYHSIRDS